MNGTSRLRPGLRVRLYLPSRSTTSWRCCGTIRTALASVITAISATAITSTADQRPSRSPLGIPVAHRRKKHRPATPGRSRPGPRSPEPARPGSKTCVASYERARPQLAVDLDEPCSASTRSSTSAVAPSIASTPNGCSPLSSAERRCRWMAGRTRPALSADTTAKTSACTATGAPKRRRTGGGERTDPEHDQKERRREDLGDGQHDAQHDPQQRLHHLDRDTHQCTRELATRRSVGSATARSGPSDTPRIDGPTRGDRR